MQWPRLQGSGDAKQASGLKHRLDSDLPVSASLLPRRPPAPWPSLRRPKPGSSHPCAGATPRLRTLHVAPAPARPSWWESKALARGVGLSGSQGERGRGTWGAEPGGLARCRLPVGRGSGLTVNRPFFSGVEGCSLRSSVCGSCTFSMPAPSSSFFSKAE